MARFVGIRDVELADRTFDAAVHVEGDDAMMREMLDAEARAMPMGAGDVDIVLEDGIATLTLEDVTERAPATSTETGCAVLGLLATRQSEDRLIFADSFSISATELRFSPSRSLRSPGSPCGSSARS